MSSEIMEKMSGVKYLLADGSKMLFCHHATDAGYKELADGLISDLEKRKGIDIVGKSLICENSTNEDNEVKDIFTLGCTQPKTGRLI